MPVMTTRRSATKPRSANSRPGGISSEAVERATGRGWDEWVKVLNKDGAAAMPHKDIAVMVGERYGVGDWWCQMVTVGYEQATGRRAKHQMQNGYRVGGSKTVPVPVATLYRAWSIRAARDRWLPGADLKVRKATANKSMRITWDAAKVKGATDLIVMFYSKGAGKSQVTVEHGKLKSAAAGEKLKRFWSQRLTKLAATLA
jgi:uncharacterized protein YndB with AHSA1/START domain